MTHLNRGLRHIIDVDGQLLGIDDEIVRPSDILERVGRGGHRRLTLVRAGHRTSLDNGQPVQLASDEVLFFETTLLAQPPIQKRLAA